MTPSEFENSINADIVENVYYFTGPEEMRKKNALDKIRSRYLPAGLEALNETVLENCSHQDIIDNAILLPVMCDRRIVLVRDWAPFTANKKEEENESPSSVSKSGSTGKAADEMRAFLADPPTECVIVFWFTKAVKPYIKKEKGFIDFDYFKGTELYEECERLLVPYGKTMRRDAFDELTEMVGQDLTRLSTELDKLAAYTMRSKTITRTDVLAVATPSPEYSIFSILDSLLEDNIANATALMNELLKQSGNNPTSMISFFVSSMRVYLMLKLAAENNSDINKVAAAFNISDGRRKFILNHYKTYPAEVFQSRYDACIKADRLVKSGLAKDRAQLDALMLELRLPKKATSRSKNSSKY